MNAYEWTTADQCETAQCVEVAWRKSSRSVDNGNCVEVGFAKVVRPVDDEVEVRDDRLA
jgi:hypothetical protein